MVAVVRRPSACAVRCICSHSSARALQAGDARADFVVQDFRAAAGNRVEPGIAQAGDGVAHAQAGNFGDAQNFRRRKAVQVQLREALLDRAQQIFVIVDAQIGIQAALHENAGAAERDGLLDLLQDGVEREDVAVLRAHGPVEGAEGAILGAEIGVVDVAIDLVGGHARIVFLLAQLIRGHADADQVVGPEEIERFLL